MIKVSLTSSRAGEGVYFSLKGAVKGISESPCTFCCFVYDDFWDLEGNHTLDGIVKDEDLHFVDISPAIRVEWTKEKYSIDLSELNKLFEPYYYPGSIIAFRFNVHSAIPSLKILEQIEEYLNTQYPRNAYQQIYLFVKGNMELYERIFGSKRPDSLSGGY